MVSRECNFRWSWTVRLCTAFRMIIIVNVYFYLPLKHACKLHTTFIHWHSIIHLEFYENSMDLHHSRFSLWSWRCLHFPVYIHLVVRMSQLKNETIKMKIKWKYAKNCYGLLFGLVVFVFLPFFFSQLFLCHKITFTKHIFQFNVISFSNRTLCARTTSLIVLAEKRNVHVSMRMTIKCERNWTNGKPTEQSEWRVCVGKVRYWY